MDENNQKRVYLNVLPLYVTNLDLGYDAFDISASLSNLENLGLISLSFVQFADNKLYEDILQKNAQIQGLYQLIKFTNDRAILEHSVCGVIMHNDFGKRFASICLK